MRKVLLIGSTGFVGQHIAEALLGEVALYVTTRQPQQSSAEVIHFDFAAPESWAAVVALAPDVIINAAGYGVVKEQTDLESTYAVNYQLPTRFICYLQEQEVCPFWIQIGTAFEYDLDTQRLHEESPCVPMTHYGISKYLCSHFLLSTKNRLPFLILRPFAMFGPYESASKLIPYLLSAQKNKRAIPLSDGEQQRDYFYVKDLARFIALQVLANISAFQGQVLNIGSGQPQSLKQLAAGLSAFVPGFNPAVWQWGALPQRPNENAVFYNASSKAAIFNFQLTPSEEAFRETVAHYMQA